MIDLEGKVLEVREELVKVSNPIFTYYSYFIVDSKPAIEAAKCYISGDTPESDAAKLIIAQYKKLKPDKLATDGFKNLIFDSYDGTVNFPNEESFESSVWNICAWSMALLQIAPEDQFCRLHFVDRDKFEAEEGSKLKTSRAKSIRMDRRGLKVEHGFRAYKIF